MSTPEIRQDRRKEVSSPELAGIVLPRLAVVKW